MTNRLRANIYTYSYIHKTEYANGQLLSYLVVDDLCKFDFVSKNKPGIDYQYIKKKYMPYILVHD